MQCFTAGISAAEESNRLIEIARMFQVPVAFTQEVRDSLELRATNGILLPWTGSLADKAERVLVDAGEPLNVNQICELLELARASHYILGKLSDQ